MVVLTMLYNLEEHRMTVLEHVRFSRPSARGPRGSGVFHQAELPRKQRRTGDMWTDAAIETLRRMALEGKSASSIAVALGAPSRNAVIVSARHGAAATPRDRSHRLSFVETSRCPRDSARAEAGMGLRRSPGRRDVKGRPPGDQRKRLPLADWGPDNRRVRLLRHSDGEGPLILRRPLPDGLQAAEFAGLGRPAIRGHRVQGCLEPQLAACFPRLG